ncbi:MAG TPA: M13 family metallopeptidase [Thermoanaerobaculia bacterium]|jgi:putative endopeptidase
MTRLFAAAAALLVLLASACATAKPPAPVVPVPEPERPLLGAHGFDVQQVDRSVEPCDDFYQYAVGGWRKANPLKPTYSRFGRFEEVAERNRATLRAILEEAKDGTQIGDFWTSCMNEQGIEEQGIAPLRADLDRIAAISSRAQLVAELHRLQRAGIGPLFRFSAQNDYRESDRIIAAISQSGLGLPDRDYYLRDDERFATTRRQYVEHIEKLFTLAGIGNAHADAGRVLALETQLARASMARVDQRDPENVYHLTPVSELESDAPNFRWRAFFTAIGLGDLKSLNVAQPEFFAAANRLLQETPLDTWKAYLRWQLLDAAAPALSTPFVQQDFAFRGQTLSGQKELQPRWQRCVRAADANIGQLLGQEYVRRNFTPEAKRKMNAMIDNLIAALREDIPKLEWMGTETKREALAKLNAFQRRIGYPDKWIDYSSLKVGRQPYVANLLAARTFAFERSVSRVGKPDDPNEWGFFTPATVNAGYSPARNDITFPAGILQPPFYDPNADDAYNYGGIGTVIGHEMTHGFDDQGAKFDAEGNLRNWWSEADLRNFQTRAECIANQYSEFTVEPGLSIQGKLVTGEAIADLGGATLALRAYRKSLEGKPRAMLDGYTPEQRFFLGFAQVWAENMAIEQQRRLALTDPHAQGPFRVNGTVANMPEFHEAWSCPASRAMVRAADKRCGIW